MKLFAYILIVFVFFISLKKTERKTNKEGESEKSERGFNLQEALQQGAAKFHSRPDNKTELKPRISWIKPGNCRACILSIPFPTWYVS